MREVQVPEDRGTPAAAPIPHLRPVNGQYNLRAKILYLACAMALFTALVIGVASSVRTQSLVRNFAQDNVAHEARLLAQQFEGAFEGLENDASVLSRLPPIGGLARSTRAGGVDPRDGSTTEQWRNRLETIFTSLIEARPAYFQMRLIGLSDGGREIVRVDRRGSKVTVVAADRLQRKGEESYFLRGRDLVAGEVYFSDINYNREQGQIDPRKIPTIRAVVPVFDDSGRQFGMIVINVDYRAIMSEAFADLALKRDVVISTEAGHSIERRADGELGQFRFAPKDDGVTEGFLARPEDPAQREWSSRGDGVLAYSVRIPIRDVLDDVHNVVTIKVPVDQLYAPARALLMEGLALTSAILLAALGVGALLATRITAPLAQMTKSIRAAMQGERRLALPTEREDEVGELAHAFEDLIESREEDNARVTAVIENAIDAIVSIDGRGRILSWNPASEALFGYRAEEMLGQNVRRLIPRTGRDQSAVYLDIYRRTRENQLTGFTREMSATRKDGSAFPVELSVSRVDLRDGTYMLTAIVRDITERRKIQVMQNEFVSTVNHELRTPLTSIRASLGILQHRITGKVDAKAEKLVDISLHASDRLARLVNDILDLEKIAAGKLEFHFEERDIGELTRAIIDRNIGLAESHHTRFVLHDRFADARYCRIDPARYAQALINLLSNAAKFSPPHEEVTVELARAGDGRVKVSVSDRGPGIPEEFREHIFKRFAQADSSASRSTEGSGLGLNISKTIVEQLGGVIHFESVEGEGTTFVITLPTIPATNQTGEAQCQAA